MKWYKGIRVCKDPSDTVDYTFDFKQLLQSDTIASYTVTVDGVTNVNDSQNGKEIIVFVSGGTNGSCGNKLTVKITTSNSPARVFERTLLIDITDK